MSDQAKPLPPWEQLSESDRQSALFANLVMQQTNAALMLLGQVPHPETGKAEVDLEGASLFIDTIEMIEARTRGNLAKPEEAMLKQSLTMLRMAFVEKVNAGATAKPEPEPAAPIAEAAPATEPAAPEPAAAEDSKKKFTKKY